MEASQTNLLLSVLILILVLCLTKKKKEGFWPNESGGVGPTGVAPYIGGSYGSTNPQYYG
jgi:hypothetical protein